MLTKWQVVGGLKFLQSAYTSVFRAQELRKISSTNQLSLRDVNCGRRSDENLFVTAGHNINVIVFLRRRLISFPE